MAVATFTLGYTNTPAYFSGTGFTTLVPSLYPVAINGRPYMVDQKSGRFQRGFEQRVRDSQDISTAPGEAAINPGGLWRRGQDSWHLGAGQEYSDAAGSVDFRFYRSKGINPWEKGHIRLLNATALITGSGAPTTATNLPMVEVNGYLYVGDGQVLKYTQNPFATTPTWTTVTGGATAAINDIATDGVYVYIAYQNNSIHRTTIAGSSMAKHYPDNSNIDYTKLGFAKGFMLAFHQDTANSHIHLVPFTAGNKGTPVATIRYKEFVCTGIVGGQNFIYVSGYNTDVGLVYRMSMKNDGTIDSAPVVALELPTGEYPTSLHAYLGFVLLGTNRGVRFCTTDNQGNLSAGQLIPTSNPVLCFTAEDRFVWFGYSNYDGTDGGLGRLDLSVFTAPNTPAYATDLMYGSAANIKSVTSMNDADGVPRRIFAVAGIGVVRENAASLVAEGTMELGTYRWGIPDRKFVAKVDVRSEPLKGSVTAYLSNDNEDYDNLGEWDDDGGTEFTYNGSDNRAIEAKFKLELTRGAVVSEGPIVTRWMARAYAAPFRSQVFVVPVILHNKIKVRNKDIFLDVSEEQDILDDLIANPRIVVLQIGEKRHSVIVEDVEWTPLDSYGNSWDWEGTATVTMRSVEN